MMPEGALRKGFGVFVVLMGAFVLSQELPFLAGPIILGVIAVLAVGAAVCLLGFKERCTLGTSAARERSGVLA